MSSAPPRGNVTTVEPSKSRPNWSYWRISLEAPLISSTPSRNDWLVMEFAWAWGRRTG